MSAELGSYGHTLSSGHFGAAVVSPKHGGPARNERAALQQVVLTLDGSNSYANGLASPSHNGGGGGASVYSVGSFSQRRYPRKSAVPVPAAPATPSILTVPDLHRKGKRKEVRWVDKERVGPLCDFALEDPQEFSGSDSDDDLSSTGRGRGGSSGGAGAGESSQLRGDNASADGDDGSSGRENSTSGSSRRRRRVRQTLKEQQTKPGADGKEGKGGADAENDRGDCRQCEDMTCVVM